MRSMQQLNETVALGRRSAVRALQAHQQPRAETPDVCWLSMSHPSPSEDRRTHTVQRLAGRVGVKTQTVTASVSGEADAVWRCRDALSVASHEQTCLSAVGFLASAVWPVFVWTRLEHIWPSMSSKQPPGL